MSEPKAFADNDQPGAGFLRSLLALALHHPDISDLEQIDTYLAEIREAIEQLPPISVTDPVESGFDPAWPDDEK